MAKREFSYKGKTLDEIKSMSISDFIRIAPARVRRSLTRELTDQQKKLLEKIRNYRHKNLKKPIKTHSRDMVIIPEMIGVTLLVHRGKEFMPVIITEDMIGHYIGEFTYNRTKVQHSAPGIGATRSSAAVSVK